MHTTLFGFLDITCEAGSRFQRHKLQQICECACSLACINPQLLQLINRLEVLDLFSRCLLLLLSAAQAQARQAASSAKQLRTLAPGQQSTQVANTSWKRRSMKARVGAHCTACSASVAMRPDSAEAIERGEESQGLRRRYRQS